MLTIITPFYAKNRDDYLYARFKKFVQEEPKIEGIHRMIVDFGSPEHLVEEFQGLCAKRDIGFIPLRKRGEPFSAGVCRNVGVQRASTEFISFQDIDLTAPLSVYARLREKVMSIPSHFNYLECIPCVYLTESGTDEYLSQEPEESKRIFDEYYLDSDSTRIHMYAPATSSIVARRVYYLAMGGVREEFFGHGFEDFDLMNRLAWKSNRFIRSHDFHSHAYKYSSTEYRGYRTYFSLFGRGNMARGLYFFHLYHPTPSGDGYASRSAANRSLFERFAKSLDKDGELPAALMDLSSPRRTLALASRNSIPMKSIRMAIPYLGRLHYRTEYDFRDVDEFLQFVKENEIDQVLFLTPYSNEHRLALYQACRDGKIKYIVFDRGALPDSWFFDPNGFNSDSSSYAQKSWNQPLSVEARESVELYISNLISSESTLEENGARIGVANFRSKYKLGEKKVLFVPLQRPGDSVIRYFAGGAENMENFCLLLSQLAARLSNQWTIVVKRHPLETEMPQIPGAVVLDPATHVYDAIAAADAVFAINSGVGLLSLLFEKPTYNIGRAFYSHPGLSKEVCDIDDLCTELRNPRSPSVELVRRFTSYLVSQFYSFAKTTYRKVGDEKGGFRSVAVNLDFSALRLPGVNEIVFEHRENPISKSSPHYDYYRAYIEGMGKKPAQKAVEIKQPAVLKQPIKKVEPVPATQVIVLPAEKERNSAKKKLRKLVKYPKLFFADALRNRLA